ncbi:MAG: ABC transporter permease [Myxococcota bacterium]
MISWRNVRALFWKETIRLRRDRNTMRSIIAQPIVFLIIYGTMITYQTLNIRWVVEDHDRTELSRRLVTEVMATGRFEPPMTSVGDAERLSAFRTRYASAAIVIPEGFKRALVRGEPAYLQLLLNGADPLVATRAGAYITRVAGLLQPAGPPALSSDALAEALGGGRIEVRRRFWYNPTLSDKFYFLAALPAILITQVCIALASAAMVNEKDQGTMEQLLSNPLNTLDIVIGKTLPYIALAYVLLVIVLLAEIFIFNMPFRGHMLALLVATFPFVLANSAIGLLFSAISRNVLQGSFIGFFFILFSVNLSDYFYPTQTMPEPVRLASYLFPMKYEVWILRGIGVRGATLPEVWIPIAACLGYFLVMLAILSRVTRKTIG